MIERATVEKKIAILQSCYIPWKGYFDIINSVDEFILYDDMQYTRRDWRNRNLIKTSNGLQWLTVPVDVKGKYLQRINETKISDLTWAHAHWKSITMNYAKSSHFKLYQDHFAEIFNQCQGKTYLSEINYYLQTAICKILNIKTKISWSTDYKIEGHLKKSERLIALCQAASANHYLSGPSAKNYIDEPLFSDAQIKVSYVDYLDYPTYPQLFGDFEHGVTVLDLLFNTGEDAHHYMKSFNK